ncbi:hypothetical protein DN069_24000 [Streptacidiphilus pinicola]|uniref:Ester cyclase n=1 Tax=Streptacidiphilus pinicola TaxID=2219663 RepID=A0A2X0IHN3_9ACTN|nr:ester cyclase [Streptacidiphilus pinicola]RAG83103.1 hypothetical protein DN069_24000 [Streptacidiphilus pinicola]
MADTRSDAQPDAQPDADDKTLLSLRCVQTMADGTLDDFRALVHPEAVNREALREPAASRGRGPAAFHATALWLRTAFADLRWELQDAVTEGDLVVLHTTMSGRHVGPFTVYGPDARPVQVFPPTGRSFSVLQTHWCRVKDGLLVEHWANRDDLGQAQQLGWAPPSPPYLLRMALATAAARRAARRDQGPGAPSPAG